MSKSTPVLARDRDGTAAGHALSYSIHAVARGTPCSPSQSTVNGLHVDSPAKGTSKLAAADDHAACIPRPERVSSGGGERSARATSHRVRAQADLERRRARPARPAARERENTPPCALRPATAPSRAATVLPQGSSKSSSATQSYWKRNDGRVDRCVRCTSTRPTSAIADPCAGRVPPNPPCASAWLPGRRYYSYFPGYAFQGGPGHLVPATHEGEEGEEDAEDGERAAVAAAHYYYPYYALPPGAMPPSDKKEDEDGNEEEEVAPPPAPEPVAPPPKKSRKKAAGDDGDKPKARGKKKKAAAAPPPPPPPGEEDELDPEDEIKDE